MCNEGRSRGDPKSPKFTFAKNYICMNEHLHKLIIGRIKLGSCQFAIFEQIDTRANGLFHEYLLFPNILNSPSNLLVIA